MSKTIKTANKLEQHIDGLLENLKIFRWSLGNALFHVLSVSQMLHDRLISQSESPFVYVNNLILEKGALEILIPKLYERCENHKGETLLGCKSPQITQDAEQALVFCKRYDSAVLAFTHMHQETMALNLEHRIATFDYASSEIARFVNLDSVIRFKLEGKGIRNMVESGSFDKLPVTEIADELLDEGGLSENITLDRLSASSYAAVRKAVESNSFEPSLPNETRCRSYTLGDAYKAWTELKIFVMAHQLKYGQLRGSLDNESAFGLSLLRFTIDELAKDFSTRIDVHESTVKSVLNDMIFDHKVTYRKDALIRPLYPLPHSTEVLMLPYMIDTADWETCLLRNLATKSPEIYGQTIAPEKVKPLTDQLADSFKKCGFHVAVRKIITEPSGKPLGDIDVAILDIENRHLSLIEVKWVIPPDSPHEDVQANREIENGREQLRRMVSYREEFPNTFIEQLYPEDICDQNVELGVSTYVISKGSLGNLPMNQEPLVLDIGEVLEVVEGCEQGLHEIWSKVIDNQRKLAPPQEVMGYMPTAIGGYLLQIPAYSLVGQFDQDIADEIGIEKVGRNRPCSCGSGIKFKKCCIDIN